MPAPPLPLSVYIVEDWFNGLYTGLMLVTVWIIVFRTRYNLTRKWGLLAFVILPYICSTIHSSLEWLHFSSAVNENELPGGPGLLPSLTHIPPWMEGTGDAFFCLNILLADCTFIWRCWTVWNRNWKIVLIPILATLASAGLAGVTIFDQVVADRSHEATIATKKKADFIRISTVYFALSIATSLLTTMMITFRILSVHYACADEMKQRRRLGRTYRLVIETLVESAAIYSVTLIIFIVLLTHKNVNVYYAQSIHAQVAGLAPMLIILRVVAGLSRGRDEWSGTAVQTGTGIEFSNSTEFKNATRTGSQQTVTKVEPW